MLDVTDYGVTGDGSTDDTEAFNAVLAQGAGDIIYAPSGNYRIDPSISLHPQSGTTLWLAPTAILRALPVAIDTSAVIYIDQDDVVIRGGQFIGERDEHQGTEGEWGHGIRVFGASRISLESILVGKCWGDGIYLGDECEDILVSRCGCFENRRQGMSIIDATRVNVLFSRFVTTVGTPPQAGVDIEPDNSGAFDILFDGCSFNDNGVYGLTMATARADIANVRVLNCEARRNQYGLRMRKLGYSFSDVVFSNFISTENAYRNVHVETDVVIEYAYAGT